MACCVGGSNVLATWHGISHTMLGLTSEALHLSNNYKSASDIYVV